jgi:acetyl esterase/lipase
VIVDLGLERTDHAGTVHEGDEASKTRATRRSELELVSGAARALWSLARRPGFAPIEPMFAGVAGRPGSAEGTRPRLDVYVPQGQGGPRPGVTLVHGGGFSMGSRAMKPVRFLARALVDHGFVVLACDYRLAPRATIVDQIDDVAAAVRFTREQGPQFGVDQRRRFVVGFSAGATLALLAAERATLGIAGITSVFGLYDFAELDGVLGGWFRRRVLGDDTPATALRHSILGSGGPAVPLTLLHGMSDTLVPHHQAVALSARRQTLGLPVRLHLYPNAQHAFFNDPSSPAAAAGLRDLMASLGA